jgi:hypothetical protein
LHLHDGFKPAENLRKAFEVQLIQLGGAKAAKSSRVRGIVFEEASPFDLDDVSFCSLI